MKIKTKKHFNEIIQSLTEEILDEEELDEITTTGDVDGYSTPNWGRGRENKRISTNSTGYKTVNEALDDKDLKIIKKLIRSVVADVYRDIWLKRTVWK